MTKLPRLGQRVRDTRIGTVAQVVGLEGTTGEGGAVFVVVRPDTLDANRSLALTYTVPLADAEPLH